MTCVMQRSAVIGSANFTISSENDSSVLGLVFQSNQRVQYLPINVSKAFPELEIYGAGACSLRTVSKENFSGLKYLRALGLQSNRIETIESDTFDDLTSLQYLYLRTDFCSLQILIESNFQILGFNRITTLGDVFTNLLSLKIVYLQGNICINEDFDDSLKIRNISRVTKEKCGAVGSHNETSFNFTMSKVRNLVEFVSEALTQSSNSARAPTAELQATVLCFIMLILSKQIY